MPQTIPHREMPILGKIIYDQRIKKELTQKELADLIGVNESYISRLERGDYFQSIRCRVAIPILDILDISLDDFRKLICPQCVQKKSCEPKTLTVDH